MSDKKPTLADLGLDAPAPPPSTKKTWQQIADQVDDQPHQRTTATAPDNNHNWNGIAAVLSFFIPGLGQLFKGHVISGLALFLVSLFCYGFLLLLGIVPHVIAIIDAGARKK